MRLSVTLDVPDIAAGLAFYGAVFGFAEVARPIPAYAVLRSGDQSLSLMEKPAGSRPTPVPGPLRDYGRHWTPVHLDFHVDNLPATLAAIRAAGGVVEAEHSAPGRRAVAFCADPFGHGFCVLGAAP